MKLRAENFPGVRAYTPGSGASGDVEGDVARIVENEERLVDGVFAGPSEAAAGHGLVTTDGEFEGDGAFAETPEAGLLFGKHRADGVGARSEEGALAQRLHDEFRGDGQKDGNGEEEEELEWIGVPGMAEDGDEVEVEDPKKEKRKDEREFGDGVEGYVARRSLEREVAIGVALLAGAEGLGSARIGGKREHRGEYRASETRGKKESRMTDR
jgi:hypothetical protein